MLKRKGSKEDDTINLIVANEEKSDNYGSLAKEDEDEDWDDTDDETSDDTLEEAITEGEEIPFRPPEEEKFNFFQDGKTRVDFVLAWEEQNEKTRGMSSTQKPKLPKNVVQDIKWRNKFVKNLGKCGLLMEMLEKQIEDQLIHYILLNAPWDVLCYHAENMCLHVPLQQSESCGTNWSQAILSKLRIHNVMYEEVPNTPPEYYSSVFRLSKLDRYLNKDNREDFFTNMQRHQIVYQILENTTYGHQKKCEIGIENLLSENVFSAAYPLHDGSHTSASDDINLENLSRRQILYKYWACWGKWYKYQPLDHIRNYFGEKIAFYFAWIGFYTAWLLPAAIVGTLTFVGGIYLVTTDIPSKEICEEGSTFNMCPLCEICKSWNLSSICNTYKLGYLFDHGGTVIFSIFMSLWAVTFLEYWKRKTAILAFRWECLDCDETEERPRPHFTVMAPMTAKNPITGAVEPFFPKQDRFRRIFTSSMVILLLIIVVLMFVISVILYRTIISIVMYESGNSIIMAIASRVASFSGSIVNLLCILILARLYTYLAHFLTKWEMHRTQSKYEDAYIVKVFLFQFINFYSSPIYIAFFKGRFVGYPAGYKTLFGVRNEACGPGGCLIELAQELLIIMVGKQLINNMQEFIIPKIKVWWEKHKWKTAVKDEANPTLQPWEQDYRLLYCEGLFEEYLEIVLQFGFITIFVAACPLAPLFALFNNWVETRLDANKFVCKYRRPVVKHAEGIGIWFNILETITTIAVISNAFLIAFTSDFLPRLYYSYTYESDLTGYINFTLAYSPPSFKDLNQTMCRYKDFRDDKGQLTLTYWNLMAIRLGFVIVFEHVVFFIARMIDVLVPDVPESVELKVKREQYMAKQALSENKTLLKRVESLAGFWKTKPKGKITKDPIPEDKLD
ncbi:anoctamin-7-like [Leucoraja erinacea]|uniref:anoctamin-7-like n=1 Tax=Leucoraja erinaceus TaxID=7782 RepID=UPI0024538A92|nr:anoctamin-7-like [Leucoraja erinacea]XP_055501924.1 anoctamin-7-like [Leucoraja erinacea]XP_055501925.1 anoctamin-7-like [Leucoraja erinacea]